MTDYNGIKVFAPATVSNLGSGFDIIGFPIEEAGDTVTLRKSETPGLRISNITGYTGVPWLPEKNTASYAVMQMMESRELDHGFEMEIHKGVKPGSGVGSSASSSAAALVAVNEWLGRPLTTLQLIELAMESEALASGSRHADNVAPSIMGGVALVRSYDPLDVVRIEPPEELWVALLHPQIEIRTETSRKILPHSVPLKDAICQWGNVAGLIAGLYSSDYELIGRSMQDVIIEPVRAELIPGYRDLKAAALEAGALNCSISGSGPSVSAICKGAGQAKRVSQAMEHAFQPMEISYETYVSRVNNQGAGVVETW